MKSDAANNTDPQKCICMCYFNNIKKKDYKKKLIKNQNNVVQ